MSVDIVVYVLTALAAVVVVLTRVRLRGDGGSSRVQVGPIVLGTHTIAGLLALVVWLVFLVAPGDTVVGGAAVGIAGLALWWITVVAGLLMLVRWLPSHGRHATDATTDGWSSGPGLSVLAHVGLLVGVVVFTWAYLTSAV